MLKRPLCPAYSTSLRGGGGER